MVVEEVSTSQFEVTLLVKQPVMFDFCNCFCRYHCMSGKLKSPVPHLIGTVAYLNPGLEYAYLPPSLSVLLVS